MAPEQFKIEQSKVASVEGKANQLEKGEKKNEKLSAELKEKHQTFFKKVDDTRTTLDQGSKLKNPEAKANLAKQESIITGALLTVAQTGEAILQSDQKNPDLTTIRQAADSIGSASYDVKQNVEFFTALDDLQGNFQKNALPLLEEIRKNGASGDQFDRKKYLADISTVLEKLGEKGSLGMLKKIEDKSLPPDLKKALEEAAKPIKDAIKEMTDLKIADLERVELGKEDSKEKIPSSLSTFLEIRKGSGSFEGKFGLGFDSIRTFLGGAYAMREKAVKQPNPEQKQKDLDSMKDQIASASKTIDKISPALSSLKKEDLPKEMLPMLALMISDCQKSSQEAKNIEGTMSEAVELDAAMGKRSAALELLMEARRLESTPDAVNIAPNCPPFLLKAYDQALFGVDGSGGIAGIIKLLRNTNNLPAKFVTETEKMFNDKVLKELMDKKVLAEQQKLTFDEKYSKYVTLVLDRSPDDKSTPLFGDRMSIVFTTEGEKLSAEEKENIIRDFTDKKATVQKAVEFSTSNKLEEKYWAAKKLFDSADLDKSKVLVLEFLESAKASKSNVSESTLQRGQYLLAQIEFLGKTNGDFFEAQKLANQGQIIPAKMLLIKYLQEHSQKKEGEPNCSDLAKQLLKSIALTQVADARGKFKPLFQQPPVKIMVSVPDPTDPERKGRIMEERPNPEYAKWAKYDNALNSIEALINEGKEIDFTEAYKKVSADLQKTSGAGLDVNDDLNLLHDQVVLDKGPEGVLELAKKYREKGRYFGDQKYAGLASEYFNQYFTPELKSNTVSLESLRSKYHANVNKQIEISNLFEASKEDVKKQYDEACKKYPQFAQTNSWEQFQITCRSRIADQVFEKMIPEETLLAANSHFQANNKVMGNKQGAWKEYMSMKGWENQGNSKDIVTLSDAQVSKLVKELPVDIAIIAAAGAIAAATGGAASAFVLDAGLGMVEREVLAMGVRSTARQVAAYGVGLGVETTAFTVSHSVLNSARTGKLSIATWEGFQKEWVDNLKIMGGLGVVGRVSGKLGFNSLTAFGTEMVAMGIINGGHLSVDDFAMVLGLKIGHAAPGMAKKAGAKAGEVIENVKEKIADRKAINSMYLSKFDSKVPEHLPANTQGWIDKDGVHYNLAYLQSKLAPGYELVPGTKGGAMIKSPTGELISVATYEGEVRGTPHEKALVSEMRKIKVHETTHQTLEFAFTDEAPDGSGKRVENPAKTKPLMDRFAEPDASGQVPPGKIPLLDINGKPMKLTWQNVQEYLSHVSDGSKEVTKAEKAVFENSIAAELPGFTFNKVRTISTKLLLKNPRQAFFREKAAAKEGENILDTDSSSNLIEHQGKPWTKITGSEQFNNAIKTEKGQESNYKIAQQMLLDFMWVMRTGDPGQIENFKSVHETLVDRKVFDRLQQELPIMVSGISDAMLTTKGMADLVKAEQEGKLTPATREVYKRLALEAKMTQELLSPLDSDGKPKSSEKRAADLKELSENLDFGGIQPNKLIVDRLSREPEGLKILADKPGGVKAIIDSMSDTHGIKFEKIPEPVREKMREAALPLLTSKIRAGKASIDRKLADLEKKKAAEATDPEPDPTIDDKIKHARELQKVYQSLELSSPEKANELFKKMEALSPPKGFEDCSSPAELFYTNFDKLNPDYLTRILDGQVKYDLMDTPNGKTRGPFIVGRNLGIGGSGEVWASVVFQGNSKVPQEMVGKKSRFTLEPEHEISGFEGLDNTIQSKLKLIFSRFKADGVNQQDGLEKAIVESNALLSGSRAQAFAQLLSRYKIQHIEVENARMVMKHQQNGKLKGFTAMNYISSTGMIFMESIANPKANYEVCEYEKIIKGELTTLDGKTPIDIPQFWAGVADIMDQLGEAHELGIVHRDLKPENMGFGPDGKIRLIDVGSIKTDQNIRAMGFHELPPAVFQAMYGFDPSLYMRSGLPAYYFPIEGGVTPGYYKGDIGYKQEAEHTPGPDGKPLYKLGYSDRTAMSKFIEDIVHESANPSSSTPKWATPDKIPALVELMTYLEEPRTDIRVVAKKLRTIMNIK